MDATLSTLISLEDSFSNNTHETSSHPRSTLRINKTMPRVIASKDILRGKQEIEIEHNGMRYRLRCTSLGKLILTK